MKKIVKILVLCLFVFVTLSFVACGNAPSTIEQAKGKMENLGYTVSVSLYEEGEKEYSARMDCSKKEDGKTVSVTAFKFSTPAEARDYMA